LINPGDADPMIANLGWGRAARAVRRLSSRALDPVMLVPAVAVLVLGVIWATTFNLIDVQDAAARHAAATTSNELSGTYEAQVVRALDEIDQTMKVVKYAYERHGQVALQELKVRNLLPPDLLFVVAIADRSGDIVATSRPSEIARVYDQDVFQSQLLSDHLSVGRPHRNARGDWELQFSRSLNAADGTFAGVVLVVVDAAYFVSGYEDSKLGEDGVLALLGTDGIFRVRRIGDSVSAGDAVVFAEVVPDSADAGFEARIATNPWDGVQRFTAARQLYDFPLAVIVGLAVDEQAAAARQIRITYLWRASAASILLILIATMLARLSRQLAVSRQLAAEEQVAHAARVEHLAYHDGLTGLANRSLFSKLLGQSIRSAHRDGTQLAVLFLDLDGFKRVNDTIGHEGGDALLQQVAARLKDCLRESDTVARLGGDEFVMLLPILRDPGCAATVAQKALDALAKPYLLPGGKFQVTASIGISTYPYDGMDEQTLTKNADIAMYLAKDRGKNNFQFASGSSERHPAGRLGLETSLAEPTSRPVGSTSD
jgi:diguanylate cyclase (GGDEF)-like protein